MCCTATTPFKGNSHNVRLGQLGLDYFYHFLYLSPPHLALFQVFELPILADYQHDALVVAVAEPPLGRHNALVVREDGAIVLLDLLSDHHPDDKIGLPRRWHFGGGLFYPYGVEKEGIELKDVEHYYEFDDSNPNQRRRFSGGRVILRVLDGTKLEVNIKPRGICYQAPGGYGGLYKGFIHGLWMGSQWMDGYKIDVTDPEMMKEIWGYCDYGSEFICNDQVGYGTTELMVVGKYPRYGYQGYGTYGGITEQVNQE